MYLFGLPDGKFPLSTVFFFFFFVAQRGALLWAESVGTALG